MGLVSMSKRPRGFIDHWSPPEHIRDLIENVQQVIRDYSDIAPLSLRQIFYILVSDYGYEKTEPAYKRMYENLNKARRAHMVSMDDIRDDGLARNDPHHFSGEEGFVSSIKYWASELRLDRQQGQDWRVFVWCEAQGMFPQLSGYCEGYGVSVLSSGGFDSVTTKHAIAKEFSDLSGAAILHIGDHDPSGVHMHNNLDEDIGAFVDYYGGNVEVIRLAVTPDQVEQYGLATAPPKASDRRAFDGYETTQAEAIPPRTLRRIVTAEIERWLDMELVEDIKAEELEIRASLTTRLARV